MNGNKPYFHNNWKLFKDADPSFFVPHTFFEVMAWKVEGWELPSSVECLIRTTHLESKKVKEYVYKRRSNAKKRIKKLLTSRTHDFCITTHEEQAFYGPTRDVPLLDLDEEFDL